jgi:hypothetical protein
MNWKSIRAVIAGVLFTMAVTTLLDIVLHVVGVYPPIYQRIGNGLALLASAYRLPIGIAGAWITARIAPSHPMRHALVLGVIGLILSVVGVVTTWNMDLGPRWYPISLAALALPEAWLGAKLCERRSRTPQVGRPASPAPPG